MLNAMMENQTGKEEYGESRARIQFLIWWSFIPMLLPKKQFKLKNLHVFIFLRFKLH